MQDSLLDNLTSLTIVCHATGIAGTIDLPPVPGKALEYTHPLAYAPAALDVASQPLRFLRRAKPTILAGCLLTLLRKYKMLYQPGHDHSAFLNERLCSAKTSNLIGALYQIATNVQHFNNNGRVFCSVHIDMETDVNSILRTLIATIKMQIASPITYSKDDEFSLDPDTAMEAEVVRTSLWKKADAESARIKKVRKESTEASRKSSKPRASYTVEHLEEDSSDGRCVMARDLLQRGFPMVQEAAGKLFRSLTKEAAHLLLSPKQATMLNNISYSLDALQEDKREVLVVKLEAMCDSTTACLAQILKVYANVDQAKVEDDMVAGIGLMEAAAEQLADMVPEDDKPIPVVELSPTGEATVKLTLRQRIAARGNV